jgi:hypothetical protein
VSAIPPNLISAIASPAAQRDQARHIDAARQASFETSRKLTGSPDALVEVEIEATDANTQVHADSGGLGSQGRYDSKPEEADESSDDEAAITVDEQGRPHIDVSV